MVITLDGPSASGKSTLARAIAQELDFYYFYTGMLYRGVAYIILHHMSTSSKSFSLKNLDFIHNISYEYHDNKPHLFYKGEDITSHLFTPELDQAASQISAHPAIRKALLPIQQQAAEKYDLVAEGRDCGSVVFPQAAYKFYITASLEVRAERKRKEYNKSQEEMMKELQERDDRDSSRLNAPLTIPHNAIVIDTSNMNVPEAIEKVLKYIKQ